jgi:2',3'-cyclic-nucleotide 2'-phosphodiesterase/3'-nucleotidase
MRFSVFAALLLAAFACRPAAAAEPGPKAGTMATLAVLETTDLHANVISYDYFKLAAEPSIGLERTATLIAQARRQYANTLLLDNGDTIQGNALADFQARSAPVRCDQVLAVYKAMNLLGFEGGSVGNHDFDFGLDFLNQVTSSQFDVVGVNPARARCAGPVFPLVLANIISRKTGQPLFAPYRIIDKQLDSTGPDGRTIKATVRIGIIGFAPPPTLEWDKRLLEGKVRSDGVVEAAAKFIPEMRAKGADLIVALVHGGLDGAPYSAGMENAAYHLAGVPGIDAMLMGHQHQQFPDAASVDPAFHLPGVDATHGMVRGVPSVMAGLWGKALGVIALPLSHDGQRWHVDKTGLTVEVRSTRLPDKSFVAPDPRIAALAAAEHFGTIGYVRTPIGSSDFRMSTYFADVGDASAVALVNLAQSDYVRRYVATNLPQYSGLPVLSVTAPSKSGAAGPADYTDVQSGPLALNSAADLYLFPNTLNAVKINGAQLRQWLEMSARRFRQIDPAISTPQELINPQFPGFNFDMPSSPELRYQIDVGQPAGQRVVDLRWRGKPLDPAMELLVATNNYRASGGGGFPGLDGSRTVLAAPDASRDILIAFIRKAGRIVHADLDAQCSWSFARLKLAGPVVFHSAPNQVELARQAGLLNINQLQADDGQGKGFALYAIDLSR